MELNSTVNSANALVIKNIREDSAIIASSEIKSFAEISIDLSFLNLVAITEIPRIRSTWKH